MKPPVPLSILFALVLVACRGERPARPVPHVAMPEASLIGRFDLREPSAPRCSWPGSQMRARFTGPWIRVALTDTPVEGGLGETDWIEVIVDNQAPRRFELRAGRHVYPLAQDLSPGEHEVTVWKRTEAFVGTITFHGFEVAAGHRIERAAPFARHIEVVGDSISAGYGNEGEDPLCGWSAALENNYQTYGAIAARALNASYTAIAWSGKGVIRNHNPDESGTLPQLYARVIPTEGDSPAAANSPAPDVYVVNLGTNDMSSGAADETSFVSEYIALLHVLRARTPNALLVLVLGPLLVDDAPRAMHRTVMRAWLTRIEETWRTTVDERITSMEVWSDPAEGSGCSFHPNVETHTRIGHELAAFLRSRLGW